MASNSAGSVTQLTHGQRIRAIIAGSAGNLIEWYDFYIYAFTALYFSSEFFPDTDPLVQIMATSGIFAVGFLMRPLGGWFFGRYADRKGRQAAMVASVLLMGVGALVIAVLPSYAQIGVAAPILLLLARMAQGFSTGGQYGTAATYLSEIAGPNRRGFYASFQYVTLIGGQLCATGLVVVLQNFLTDAQMSSYGWRIGFAIGAVGALAIILFRHHMHETTTAEQRTPNAGSLKVLFVSNWRSFLIVVGLTAGGSLSFYTFTTYMQKYLVNTAGMHAKTASYIMTGALFFYMCMQPVFGMLADKIGRRNSMLWFGALGTLCTVPILLTLKTVSSPFLAFVLITLALAIVSFYTSISGLVKAEMFPPQVRALGVGLAYAVANAIFGGSAEYVALGLKSMGMENTFYWYVTAMMAVAFLFSLRLPREAAYLHHDL